MGTDILLSTLNARYQHCAFGLRYIYANLEELQNQAQIIEFTIAQDPYAIVQSVLQLKPKIVGFGVYIWNTVQTEHVITLLKKIEPSIHIVVGGPEVSYEAQMQTICQKADYVISGESEFSFRQLCRSLLTQTPVPQKWIASELPEIHALKLPYQFYSEEDVRNRVIYVEASRGCPYKCEYCLSSLDKSVRSFPLDIFLNEMETLINRGVKQFKFVDRTFNLSPETSTRILKFFLDALKKTPLFLHFEMVPDRLPNELKELLPLFPPGSLQFEIGIQTWDPEVSRHVSRRQNYEKVRDNFLFLAQQTHVHTHADLIVGLPGETLESFEVGFNALSQLGPHEIQVGILKRLKGTPIARHEIPMKMIYSDHPPFQILQTSTMSFETIMMMTRFSRHWDLIANSGQMTHFMKQFRAIFAEASFFKAFLSLSQFLSTRFEQTHGIALSKLFDAVFDYVVNEKIMSEEDARSALRSDYERTKRTERPHFMRTESAFNKTQTPAQAHTPSRQRAHLH